MFSDRAMIYIRLKDKVDLMHEARKRNVSLSSLLVESAKYVKDNKVTLSIKNEDQ
jgi:hypothetical protein